MMLNINEVIEISFNYNIRSIYDNIRNYNGNNDIPIEDSKCIFIDTIRYLVSKKIGILKFREWVDNHHNLDISDLEYQIDYISRSFPDEYDENIPEKDIDNLWWYVGCPVDIGWLQPDGSYWFS